MNGPDESHLTNVTGHGLLYGGLLRLFSFSLATGLSVLALFFSSEHRPWTGRCLPRTAGATDVGHRRRIRPWRRLCTVASCLAHRAGAAGRDTHYGHRDDPYFRPVLNIGSGLMQRGRAQEQSRAHR